MRNIIKCMWELLRHPKIFYITNKTAIWVYIACIMVIVFVIIPWFVGFITILDWIFK